MAVPMYNGTILCRTLGKYKQYVNESDIDLSPYVILGGFFELRGALSVKYDEPRCAKVPHEQNSNRQQLGDDFRNVCGQRPYHDIGNSETEQAERQEQAELVIDATVMSCFGERPILIKKKAV